MPTKKPFEPTFKVEGNTIHGVSRSSIEAEAMKELAIAMGKLADAFGFKGMNYTGISIHTKE